MNIWAALVNCCKLCTCKMEFGLNSYGITLELLLVSYAEIKEESRGE